MTELIERPHLQRAYRMGRAEEYGTLQALAQEVQRLELTKRDFIVDTRRMTFSTVEHENVPTSFLTFDAPDDFHDDGVNGGPVNEHAHKQIRERLNIPARYYERMRKEAHTLLDGNVQHWLSNPPDGRQDKRMVRMLDGKVRAFLSNRYRRLDNIALLDQAILPTFGKHGDGLVFHVAALTDERMYLRAILPGLSDEVKVGQIVQAGVQIKNSEVGDGALDISPYIWKLDCLNGMVSNVGSLRRYHVGRAQEEAAYEMYRDDTLTAIDAAFFLQVRDAVDAALSETQFTLIVREMKEAATGERMADPVASTERLTKAYDLSEREGVSLLTHVATGGDLTKWGAANAVTAMAKDASTFTRQEELENLGYALVTMPHEEWARIAR